MKNNQQNTIFQVKKIGEIEAKDYKFCINIYDEYKDALYQLDKFSHVNVFWWFSQNDNPEKRAILQTELPYAKSEKAGVFACRADYRPNPIATTICKIIKIDHEKGKVFIEYCDAFDKTPVIDLKPYIPVCDRVRDVKVANWFSEWPDWYEDAGEFFSKYSFE
jgi:tRNA-Thr(GGU) m(6)t(6)A37 methyltransferase TsaA